jgi:hypothetical protein
MRRNFQSGKILILTRIQGLKTKSNLKVQIVFYKVGIYYNHIKNLTRKMQIRHSVYKTSDGIGSACRIFT